MKYPVDSVLRFTAKALRREKVDKNERLIVQDENTVLVYEADTKNVIFVNMFKTQDSYVELANETIPDVLYISKPILRMHAPSEIDPLISKYNIQLPS